MRHPELKCKKPYDPTHSQYFSTSQPWCGVAAPAATDDDKWEEVA